MDVRTSRTLPGRLAELQGRAGAGAGGRPAAGFDSSGFGARLAGTTAGGEVRVPLISSGPALPPPLRLTDGAPLPVAVELAAARVPQRIARLEQVCVCVCVHAPPAPPAAAPALLRHTPSLLHRLASLVAACGSGSAWPGVSPRHEHHRAARDDARGPHGARAVRAELPRVPRGACRGRRGGRRTRGPRDMSSPPIAGPSAHRPLRLLQARPRGVGRRLPARRGVCGRRCGGGGKRPHARATLGTHAGEGRGGAWEALTRARRGARRHRASAHCHAQIFPFPIVERLQVLGLGAPASRAIATALGGEAAAVAAAAASRPRPAELARLAEHKVWGGRDRGTAQH